MSVAVSLPSAPAISTYADLIAAVAENLNRGDLTDSQIPLAIANAERFFNRTLRVRNMLTTDSIAAIARDVEMPIDFLKMHYAARSDGKELLASTLSEVTRRKDFPDGVEVFAQIGGVPPSIRLSPAPTSEVLDIIYFAKIPNLSVNQQANWLLDAHHDLYYYAAIAECEGFLRSDEWLGAAVERRDQIIAEIQMADSVDRDPVNDILRTEFTAVMPRYFNWMNGA